MSVRSTVQNIRERRADRLRATDGRGCAGQAGIVLGLEVSRLARYSTDWDRSLDLCSLIGAPYGIYHPRRPW